MCPLIKMDDFDIQSLSYSKNEYACRLITSITPLIIEGFRSIFDESYSLCNSNQEQDKYLMTFQNLIARIPKWNPSVIEDEKKRIIEKSRMSYLEDLLSCVHIIQLKAMTNIRVGNKQKKIQIQIPKLGEFIHKCYIHSSRKIYKNVYLFEIGIPALQIQKNNRQLEIIVQECILQVIRDSIPIEEILKTYLDDTIEEHVEEEIKEEEIKEEDIKGGDIKGGDINGGDIKGGDIREKEILEEDINRHGTSDNIQSSLKFNDIDQMMDINNNEHIKNVPKTIDNLEEISKIRNDQRKYQESIDADDDFTPIKIMDTMGDQNVNIDFEDIYSPPLKLHPDFILDDIEVLG